MQHELVRLLPARKGHFLLESGHHGDTWLDLELLCLNPAAVRCFADELADRLAKHRIAAVCGPLVEGAFIGLMVATRLGVLFTYSERVPDQSARSLYPFQYRIPGALRNELHGKRVAIVNDVINAGSAVRGTFADLESCGANPVAIGSLAALGDLAAQFAQGKSIALEAIAVLPNTIWTPAQCPLCKQGLKLC